MDKLSIRELLDIDLFIAWLKSLPTDREFVVSDCYYCPVAMYLFEKVSSIDNTVPPEYEKLTYVSKDRIRVKDTHVFNPPSWCREFIDIVDESTKGYITVPDALEITDAIRSGS